MSALYEALMKRKPLPPLPPSTSRNRPLFYQMEVISHQAQNALNRGIQHRGNVPRNRQMDPNSRRESA